MPYKLIVATILSILAFTCSILIVLGMLGLLDLQYFAIGAEIGMRVLSMVAVAALLLLAILYYNE